MTPDELSEHITKAFGPHRGAAKQAARALPMNYDNLLKMLAGKRPIPEWIGARIDGIIRLSVIDAPPSSLPSEGDRDNDCSQAIEPHLDHLMERARRVGWEPSEIIVSAVGWGIHMAIESAGPEAARQMLRDAMELVDLQAGMT